jgi:peptide methionine sulfoxide reductase msrA/msrB
MKKIQLMLALLISTFGFAMNTMETEKKMSNTTERAIFASGCFWGTEFYLQKVDGVISTSVGYIGGHLDNPTYQEVCGKKTGHYEAVEVVFDPEKVSYETLARMFFETHDPTQSNGQGPDIGPQYRSAVFYTSEEQKETTTKLIGLLEDNGLDIDTKVIKATTFWEGERYHQDYYDNKGGTPYCHGYKKLF